MFTVTLKNGKAFGLRGRIFEAGQSYDVSDEVAAILRTKTVKKTIVNADGTTEPLEVPRFEIKANGAVPVAVRTRVATAPEPEDSGEESGSGEEEETGSGEDAAPAARTRVRKAK